MSYSEELYQHIENFLNELNKRADELNNCHTKLNKMQFNVDTFLTHGIGYNRLEQVKNSIKLGANINCKIKGGKSPLIYALEESKKNFTIIEYLINNGSDLNYISDDGNVPLSMALDLKNIEIIKLLINNGSNINDLNYSTKENCLHISVLYGLKEIVEFVLKKYSNLIDSKNINGKTPLFYAVDVGNLEIIKILLNNGADIDIKQNDGLNVLIYAINYKNINVNIIKLFIQHYQKIFKFQYYSKIFDEALENAKKLRLNSIILLFKDYEYEKKKTEEPRKPEEAKIPEEKRRPGRTDEELRKDNCIIYISYLKSKGIIDGRTMATWLSGKDRSSIEYKNVMIAYKYVYENNKCSEFKKDGKKSRKIKKLNSRKKK